MKHKTALVTAASIVGVVFAGATAIGANLGILSSTDTGTLSAATPVNPAGPRSMVVEQPRPTAAAAAAEPVAYEIPGVGVVTLLRDGTLLRVAGIDLAAGWSWELERDGDVVALRLDDGSTILRFQADALGGEVAVAVTQEQIAPAVPSIGTAEPSSRDDDHHEDSYEDDDDRYEDGDGSHDEDD